MLLKAALIDVFLVIGFVCSPRVWNKDLRLRRGGAKLRITVEQNLITSLLSGCLFVCLFVTKLRETWWKDKEWGKEEPEKVQQGSG